MSGLYTGVFGLYNGGVGLRKPKDGVDSIVLLSFQYCQGTWGQFPAVNSSIRVEIAILGQVSGV